jgi:hypothetical protein
MRVGARQGDSEKGACTCALFIFRAGVWEQMVSSTAKWIASAATNCINIRVDRGGKWPAKRKVFFFFFAPELY